MTKQTSLIKPLEWKYISGLEGDIRAYGINGFEYLILDMFDAFYLRINQGGGRPKSSVSYKGTGYAKGDAQEHHNQQVEQYLEQGNE